MLRMEIALFLVLAFVAVIYFSAGREHSKLHKTFSFLLIAILVHLVFDAATVYTVNHLDTVPRLLNDLLHRFFIGTMVLIVYLFFNTSPFWSERRRESPASRTSRQRSSWGFRSWAPCCCPFTTPSPRTGTTLSRTA